MVRFLKSKNDKLISAIKKLDIVKADKILDEMSPEELHNDGRDTALIAVAISTLEFIEKAPRRTGSKIAFIHEAHFGTNDYLNINSRLQVENPFIRVCDDKEDLGFTNIDGANEFIDKLIAKLERTEQIDEYGLNALSYSIISGDKNLSIKILNKFDNKPELIRKCFTTALHCNDIELAELIFEKAKSDISFLTSDVSRKIINHIIKAGQADLLNRFLEFTKGLNSQLSTIKSSIYHRNYEIFEEQLSKINTIKEADILLIIVEQCIVDEILYEGESGLNIVKTILDAIPDNKGISAAIQSVMTTAEEERKFYILELLQNKLSRINKDNVSEQTISISLTSEVLNGDKTPDIEGLEEMSEDKARLVVNALNTLANKVESKFQSKFVVPGKDKGKVSNLNIKNTKKPKSALD